MPELDDIDWLVVNATQAGLPISARPYYAIAEQTGIDVETVMQRIRRMQSQGIIRRIGAVPNHYSLGYRENGMSVWDVDDARIDELGRKVGQLEFVSHCYRRPRHLPEWPYNLFAMVHAHDRETTEKYIRHIETMLGDAVRSHDVLYSTRLLKKTGMRIMPKANREDTLEI